MTTRITGTNITDGSIVGSDIAANTITTSNLNSSVISQLNTAPTITQIQITNSSYTVLDDTAVASTGGYIKITGTNFTAGSQVVIGSVAATSVGFVSSTVLNVQVPAQAAGTYIVYVTTNTGSVAILVNGLTYSGTPTWVTGSTLASGVVDTAISIQLSATGDAPVTYALQAGSSLPAGLTLTSGGLLSGTITGITVQTTYNFTIEAIDAEAQESPRAFSITIAVNDEYFAYVTSLLSAAGPASTFVTDASANAFAVTVNGDARPNNFNPFQGTDYSVFFDGTGDYIDIAASAAQDLGTSDFTYECFWYTTTLSSRQAVFCAAQDYWFGIDYQADGKGLGLWASASGSSWNIINSDGGGNGITSVNPVLGTWNHIAVSRTGGSWAMWLNGTRILNLSGLTASVASKTAVAKRIGTWAEAYGFPINGYISNARLVIGSLIYNPASSTITVPTSALTAVSNTVILTCQSSRFRDNSTNNFAITRNGDARIAGFPPFTASSSYATYGSGYFDGTGDYLSLAYNAAFNLGTGSFTWESWIYPTNISGIDGIYATTGGSGANPKFVIHLNAGTPSIHYNGLTGGSDIYTTATSAVPLNAWTHLAFVRNSTTWTWYINGTAAGTGSNSTDITFTSQPTYVGYGGEAYFTEFNGYISNTRLVKGTAVYTSSFTPSTTPLTAIANTSLLTLQANQPNNNSMFLDDSGNNLLLTRNGNATQGSFNPYTGGYSMYTNGSNSYGYYAYNSNRALGTGDFSVECWVYVVSQPVSYTRIWGHQGSWGQPGNIGLELAFDTVDSQMIFLIAGNSQTYYSASVSTTASDWKNRWIHVLVTRQSGTLRAFLNGVLKSATAGATTNINGGLSTAFGTQANLTPDYTEQYISNFRMCVGSVPTSYQTSSTTPGTTVFATPTSPLTPTSQGATNVRLLAFQNSSYIDNSPLNSTLLTANTPLLQRFSPFSPQTPYTATSYSVSFDGSGDYIDVVNSSTCSNFGTGDFTVEGWFYFASVAQSILVDFRTGPSDVAGSIYNSGTSIAWYVLGADRIIGGTLQTGQWYHIALSRSGTSTKLFLNGTQVGSTYTDTNNYVGNTNRPRWGHLGDGTGTLPFTGLMSNLRIVKGTAVYTANFTPPSAPLTAIANTSLLTCQNSTIIDNSVNNFTITASGNATPKITNPFGYTSATPAAYAPSTYSGSAYFDGNGDSVSLASNTLLNWGTSNFTIEFWAYDDGSSVNYPGILSTVTGWSAGSISIRYNNTGLAGKFSVHWNPAGDPFMASASTFPSRAWHHVALTRSGNTFTMYVNGTVQATGTSSNNWDLSYGGTSIGYSVWDGAQGYYKGYVSDLRLIRGQVLYTGPFVPPTAPLTATANTVMLNNMTGAGIYDSAMAGNYESFGNSSISTSIKKYGNTSMSFDGSGDYLANPNNFTLDFNAGAFTVEAWVYLNNTSSTKAIVWGRGNNSFGLRIGQGYLGNVNGLNIVRVGVADLEYCAFTFATNTWYHVAVVRSGTTIYFFVNGVQQTTLGSGAGSYNYANTTTGFYVGCNENNLEQFAGYIDDLRVTTGVARYTSNFTPPAGPFIQF
jgi:hypothetical protein